MDDSNITSVKRLATFDFDLTIVQDNTDVIVRDLIDPSQITPEIEALVKTDGWTAHMQAIFTVLHKNQIKPKQITDIISEMPAVPGMIELIRKLAEKSFDVIIISDSNSVFIENWCESNCISNCIKHIYTNPSKFTENGELKIEPYHWQTECQRSSKNLCKGNVLKTFLDGKANDPYESIYYIGDGRNDFCPVLKLGSTDYACAKTGLRLDLDIQNRINSNEQFSPNVIQWNDGFELHDKIMKSIEQDSS